MLTFRPFIEKAGESLVSQNTPQLLKNEVNTNYTYEEDRMLKVQL